MSRFALNKKFSLIILSFLLLVAFEVTSWAQQSPAPAALPAAEKTNQAASSDQDGLGAPKPIPPARNAKSAEDWTTPKVDPGVLLPIEALQLGQADYPGYIRELVHVKWREGDPIDLWVIRPADVKNPPVVLYLYSYPSDSDTFANLDTEKLLTANGMAAVGFVSALTGQRYHDIAQKKWFISELQQSLAESTHDVQMVLNFLATRGDLDMTRVGMYGVGSGASIAIMAAAVDSRIKALELINPWGDWPVWLAMSSMVPEDERRDYVKPEFLSKLENLDPVKWLPELRTQQVRLQFIKDIKVTPDEAKARMQAAAPSNVEVVGYATKKEFLAKVGSMDSQLNWMKQQLQPPAIQVGKDAAPEADSGTSNRPQ
jgi:hypothetical protein